jgi:hypothetical protein
MCPNDRSTHPDLSLSDAVYYPHPCNLHVKGTEVPAIFFGGVRLTALEAARKDLISAMVYAGPYGDTQSPMRLVRAYFGDRWISQEVNDLSEDMVVEATEFLHRVAMELRSRGPARPANDDEYDQARTRT